METAERQHKVIAVVITLAIHGLLLLLFLLWVFKTPLPPFESTSPGLELNFGDMVEGTGDTEASGIGDNDPSNNLAKTPPNSNSSSENNTTLTSSVEESIAIKEKKNIDKPDNKTENATEKVTEPVVNSELAQALSKLKNKKNGTGGDGNSGKAGNEGDPKGDPTKDGSGGKDGIDKRSHDLKGRVMVKRPSITDNSQEQGKVVVEVIVDETGKVISAEAGARGTTISNSATWSDARQAALHTKFNASPDGASEQKGTITFIYVIN